MSVLHGGVVYAAADVVGYFALLSVLDDHESAATVDISVSVLKGHVGETLVLNGRVAKRGRQVSFMETECHVDGKLVATAKGDQGNAEAAEIMYVFGWRLTAEHCPTGRRPLLA